MEKGIITRVETDENIIQVRMMNVEKNPLFVADIFSVLAKYKVNIDMISSVMLEDELRIDFTCEETDQSKLNQAIRDILKDHQRMEVYSSKNVGKLITEGEGMKERSGIAASIFQILGKGQIPFTQVTTSETSISYVIEKKYLAKAKQLIEEEMK